MSAFGKQPGFGPSSTTPQPSNVFGTLSGPAAGNPAPPTAGGGSLFGNTTGAPAPGSGLFGGTSAGLFGNRPTTAAPPTAPAPGSLFGGAGSAAAPTTTPATGSLFGGSTAPTAATPTSGSLFGGGSAPSLFSSNKPAENNAGNASKPSLFGGNASSAAPSTTTASATPATGTGLFGLPPKPTDTASTPSASATQPAAGASAGTAPSLFGGSLFNKPPTAPTTSPNPVNTSAISPFSLGGSKDASGSSTTIGATTPAPSGGLFAKPEEKKDGGATPTPTFSLFGAKTEPQKDTATGAAVPTTAAKEGEKLAHGPSASIAVPPPSMLRGKTLEEIVNRWSSELDTHARDFSRFAAEVAVWDRALIENGNNLTALYSHVAAAERQQNDIDQSLDHIEQQQKDLASTLDAYEKISQELLGGQGGSLRTLDTGPADTERDKNYMLATDLHTQLDDLSGSLSQMIEAVNALSLSHKPNGESNEDPVTQISQILSSHLESLQWIDSAVREVDTKVLEVEKRVKDAGYGLSSNSSQSKSRGFGLNR